MNHRRQNRQQWMGLLDAAVSQYRAARCVATWHLQWHSLARTVGNCQHVHCRRLRLHMTSRSYPKAVGSPVIWDLGCRFPTIPRRYPGCWKLMCELSTTFCLLANRVHHLLVAGTLSTAPRAPNCPAAPRASCSHQSSSKTTSLAGAQLTG